MNDVRKRLFIGTLSGLIIATFPFVTLKLAVITELSLFQFIYRNLFFLNNYLPLLAATFLTEILILMIAGFVSSSISKRIISSVVVGGLTLLTGIPIYTPPIWIFILNTILILVYRVLFSSIGGFIYLRILNKK